MIAPRRHLCSRQGGRNGAAARFYRRPGFAEITIRPFILDAIDAFGPDRCMFGSNFPVERLSCGYTRLWAAYAQVTADFTEAERRDLFAGAAARAYRIGS